MLGFAWSRFNRYGIASPTLGPSQGNLSKTLENQRQCHSGRSSFSSLLWQSICVASGKANPHFKPAKLVIKWGRCSAAIPPTSLRLSRPRDGWIWTTAYLTDLDSVLPRQLRFWLQAPLFCPFLAPGTFVLSTFFDAVGAFETTQASTSTFWCSI